MTASSGGPDLQAQPGPGTEPAAPINVHKSAAALLVRQYLGEEQAGGLPRSLGSNFRRNHDRKGGDHDNLAHHMVQHGAAMKIQKSFRRYRSEQSLRRRSFGKFGDEALELIRRYTAASGRLYEETFASKAHLVLHFDINKTILMSDKAQGGDVDFIVNSLLSDCAWGRLEPGPVWVPVGRLATDRPANDLQLMSYRSYLDSFLLPFESGRSPETQQRNTERKAERQARKRTFTEPGQPGHMFRGVFERLRSALLLPEGHDNRGPLFQNGDIHILPSFFNLLIHLQNQERDFTIVFRSFGEDIPAVMEEMNMFCTGQHPQYPGVRMDGSDGRTDLRLSHPDSLGIYHRSSTKPDGSALLIGSPDYLFTLPQPQRGLSRADLVTAADEGHGMLLETFQDIHSYFLQHAQRHNRAFAIWDYYPFWKSRNERSHAGKPFFLDLRQRDTLEIFFDDNIGHTTAHIVDAREVCTGEPLPFKAIVGKHMLKVEPLNAILDPHYFVRAVHECVVAWLKSPSDTTDASVDRKTGYGPRRPFSDDQPEWESRNPVANTSRRARDLWSILQTRLVAFIRLKHALQQD